MNITNEVRNIVIDIDFIKQENHLKQTKQPKQSKRPRQLTQLNIEKNVKKPKVDRIIKKDTKNTKNTKANDDKINDDEIIKINHEPEITIKHNYRTLLSQNGYRICKKFFSDDDIAKVKSDLTVLPYDGKSDDKIDPYPIYRETPTELIVPKFYGINKFGEPDKNSLIASEGTVDTRKTDFKFIKEMRDFQIPIIEKCMTHLKAKKGGFLSVGCGRGKCHAKGTKILMYDGSIKNIEDIQIGEKVMGDDSTPRIVRNLGRGVEEMYDVINASQPNEKYRVNKSHILSLYDIINNKVIDISVKDYLKLNEVEKTTLYGFRVAVNFDQNIIANTEIQYYSPYEFGFKHCSHYGNIPLIYKCANYDNRMELLHGILDSLAIKLNNNTYEIVHYNETLINDILFVCRSLNIYCYTKNINNNHILTIIFGHYTNYPIKIEYACIDEYYGIEIDCNHRYVMGDFTVTHNTVMALKMAAELGLKTLVIVHKTFLQDQWIERIKQFTNARYGIIRQNKVQVKDTDIVVGMIQSISMKDYSPAIFKDFGCVIVDEAHHAAAKIFSNCLYKTGAEYTIGLSATLKRKDGLTKVLHWYLGNMMYSEKAKINKQVVVKTFNYKSNDVLFREKKRWRGNGVKADVIKMTTNLCNLNQRTQHLINIINELRKQPERKILILSGRKEHLKALKTGVDNKIQEDIKNQIIEEDECKTYFYTGDSTRDQRKEAEDNGDILFGTFDLAEEGLDIERLNTIVLATPKKNIVQAVGRIMRKILQSGDVRPLIIDFNDLLSAFTAQGEVRKTHYNKHKYKIENYYIKNNKIITFDDFMMQEENYTEDEVKQLPERFVYEPNLEYILSMQRVEDEDKKAGIENEYFEITEDNQEQQNNDNVDNDNNDNNDNNDSGDEYDSDDDNSYHRNKKQNAKKTKQKNTVYMF